MNGNQQVTLRKHREGFTEEEVNFDIKYRMEKGLEV